MIKEPAFTLGIEEEYLLVDRETRDLAVNPPPELFEAAKIALGDRVTPEFLRSQIEVGTSICSSLDEARAAAAPVPHHRRRAGRAARPGAGRGLDPSVRRLVAPDAHRQGALQHAGARSAGARAPPADLRHACACRARGPGAAHRPDEPGLVFPAAPAGALDLIAVLAGRGYRAQELPPRGVRRVAAHRAAGDLRFLGRVRAAPEGADQGRADRGRQQAVVGPAAERALPDAGAARHRRLHAARGHARASRRSIAASCACCIACAGRTSAGGAMPRC